MVTSLYRVSLYFLLFQFKKYFRTVSPLCFSSSAENKRAGSTHLHLWSFRSSPRSDQSLVSSPQIRFLCSINSSWNFFYHSFVNYFFFYEAWVYSGNTHSDAFKSFSRVKSTQDENVRFIKGNELKIIQVEFFSLFKSVESLNIHYFKVFKE